MFFRESFRLSYFFRESFRLSLKIVQNKWTIFAFLRFLLSNGHRVPKIFLANSGETSISSTSHLKIFSLSQNYPNPFNAETTITYELPMRGKVNLSVYNINGQKIRTLVDGKRNAGSYSVLWDGRNDEGYTMASGFYLYRLRTNRFVKIRTMVYIR